MVGINKLLDTSEVYKTKKGYIAHIKISVDGCIVWTTIHAPRKRDVVEIIHHPGNIDEYIQRRKIVNGQLLYEMTDEELAEFCKKHGGRPRDYK